MVTGVVMAMTAGGGRCDSKLTSLLPCMYIVWQTHSSHQRVGAGVTMAMSAGRGTGDDQSERDNKPISLMHLQT
jgi:hypothetical protein